MLIVLEGLDGAGKSTQVKLLAEYLMGQGKETRFLHFPRFDAPVFGELIAKFLRGDFGAIEAVHPQLVALLFAEDRADAAKIIRGWLNEGYVVILDRYVYSNIAFQCSKLASESEAADLRNWIIDLEFGRYEIPKPDLNIFLDVPIGFVDKKLHASRKGADREYLNGKNDIHEADIEFQKKVRKTYLEQCSMDPAFKRIDCSDEHG
ncbi:MAG: dTMP kinase, partial [Bacteroidales bacterium]|nr:dTMP kinase [Bacteroidales bacterium]